MAMRRLLAPGMAATISLSLSWMVSASLFCARWMRKTIRKVTMVVPVLITSCQVSEKWKSGPVASHSAMTSAARPNAQELPVQRVTFCDPRSSALPMRVRGRLRNRRNSFMVRTPPGLAEARARVYPRCGRVRERQYRVSLGPAVPGPGEDPQTEEHAETEQEQSRQHRRRGWSAPPLTNVSAIGGPGDKPEGMPGDRAHAVTFPPGGTQKL